MAKTQLNTPNQNNGRSKSETQGHIFHFDYRLPIMGGVSLFSYNEWLTSGKFQGTITMDFEDVSVTELVWNQMLSFPATRN